MAANATLIARVTDLVALFNRKSLDLPDGLFDRQTQFLLNGTPFEAMLGRSPSDPLVLMIARGPAGYRFAIKALQHAIPDARVEIGEVEDTGQAEACVVPLWLSGQLRGTRSPVDVVVRVSVGATEAGSVTRADALIDPAMLEPIREARLRE
jgi:hypothetical protein